MNDALEKNLPIYLKGYIGQPEKIYKKGEEYEEFVRIGYGGILSAITK